MMPVLYSKIVDLSLLIDSLLVLGKIFCFEDSKTRNHGTLWLQNSKWLSTELQKKQLEVFCEENLFKNFANFTRKHLQCVLFLIKLQDWGTATSLRIHWSLSTIWKTSHKSVWSNLFWYEKYIYSESLFSTIYIETKHKCWKNSFRQKKKNVTKKHFFSFANSNSSQF